MYWLGRPNNYFYFYIWKNAFRIKLSERIRISSKILNFIPCAPWRRMEIVLMFSCYPTVWPPNIETLCKLKACSFAKNVVCFIWRLHLKHLTFALTVVQRLITMLVYLWVLSSFFFYLYSTQMYMLKSVMKTLLSESLSVMRYVSRTANNSASFLVGTSVRSPRKLVIFII